MDEMRTREFLELLSKMTLTDLLGFKAILGVADKENFDEMVEEMAVSFNGLGRKQRRELLRLAKDVVKENKRLGLAGFKVENED